MPAGQAVAQFGKRVPPVLFSVMTLVPLPVRFQPVTLFAEPLKMSVALIGLVMMVLR